MAADVTFFVGEEFTSFTELHRRIQSFQLRNSVQLYIRSSRKIQAAQVRSTDGYNPELKFAEIYYACVRGGRKFQSRGNATAVTTSRHYGRVEQSSSRQINCPFHIKIRCTRDGQKLYIKDFNSSHNHGTTEQDAVLSRSRTRHYWPNSAKQSGGTPPPPPPVSSQQTSLLVSKPKAATSVITTVTSTSKDCQRQVALPIPSDGTLPKDPVLFQLLSSPQPSSLAFQNLFFVPKNSSGGGGGLPGPHPAIVFQPGANLGQVDGQGSAIVKDEPTDSGDFSDCDIYLEPECILQYDEDKCFEPCTADSKDGDGPNCGPSLRLASIDPGCSHNNVSEWSSGHKCVSHDSFNGGTHSGVVLQALKAVLNGDRGSLPERKADGEASVAERYVVGRSDIEALTRFCSQCGARSLEMRSESQKDGSLLVASFCKGGHRIEWRFQRL